MTIFNQILELSSSAMNLSMVNIGAKQVTPRKAVAAGRIQMSPQAFEKVQNRTLPKGDVLSLAEVAGITGAKKTTDLLPLCHPLPLDSVNVKFHLDSQKSSIWVECEAFTHAKTGVEMEALTGVNIALLSIYDLVKGVDPALIISDIHLQLKEGGKSGKWVHPEGMLVPQAPQKSPKPEPFAGLTAGIITISDRCSSHLAEDQSGQTLFDFLRARGAEVSTRQCIPDDIEGIRSLVRVLLFEPLTPLDLLFTTGGTGLGPRDVTSEAFKPLWDKEIPGVGELLRANGSHFTPMSWLSRSEGGIIGKTLVICLPGSPKAVNEGMTILEEIIPHAIHIAKGAGH